MEKPDIIPLFPLDVVLLPSMVLPLHIFEPRYKAMIGRCLGEKIEFGMILASGEGVAKTGCTAEITLKVKDYPDGRMDILAEGRSVFGVKELLDRNEYYEGIVEYLPDEPSTPDAEQETRIKEIFEKCHMAMFGRPWGDTGQTDTGLLAYRMTAYLPMELRQKQSMLETRKESDRRGFLLAWLEKFLPVITEREQLKKRAGGNGHAVN
jgi:Lon protease-like protein